MEKGGKLTKLKSMLKKMPSFKISRTNDTSINNFSDDDKADGKDLHTVYVGKSRRRYFITTNVMANPLFRELVERSGTNDDSITVGCEVVLFEHLLWMLENTDPQLESLEELVDFYAC